MMMKLFLAILCTLTFVIVASTLSVNVWEEKKETIAPELTLTIKAEMTIAEFGEVNNLSQPLLRELFAIDEPQQLQQTLNSLKIPLDQLDGHINQQYALSMEHNTKNWFKIPLKFALWFAYLTICFVLLRRGKINRKIRLLLYAGAFTLFGVILGADPSPMGTVKDAIVLYATKGVIFKPRMVAFTVFTLTVIVANKFICSWGCQLGTLQDFLFRLNRNTKDSKARYLPQLKIPFILSNSIRIVFLAALIWIAAMWGYDLSHEIDPFKIFKPMTIGIVGWGFILSILALSTVVYRPWCQLFCPFGFTGWLFEKLSVFRIKVNRDRCISCMACEKACPTTVMGAILKGDKIVIPDCFSCGSCIETCPSEAISFSRGKREKLP